MFRTSDAQEPSSSASKIRKVESTICCVCGEGGKSVKLVQNPKTDSQKKLYDIIHTRADLLESEYICAKRRIENLDADDLK